ncbi:MAG: TraK family protein, partial [Shewanella sp.]
TKAIEDGYSVKTIWLFLKESGKIQCCYKTFLRYVKRFMSPLPPQDVDVVNHDTENLKQSVAAAEKMNKAEEKKLPQKPESLGLNTTVFLMRRVCSNSIDPLDFSRKKWRGTFFNGTIDNSAGTAFC